MEPQVRDRLEVLERAFSPSSPILARDFFLGRIDQIESVVDGINERGLHIIVHGERGVGKTSFSNAVASELLNVFPVKVTCNRNDNFKSLWEKAFGKVQFEQKVASVGFIPNERKELAQLDLFLPNKDDISTLDVQFTLEKIDANLLFIFDEYDAVLDSALQQKMADTIKSLSDNAPRVTIMVVGIAENVTGLIGEHPSLERCLRQIHLPRMSESELALIVDRGLILLGMQMPPRIRSNIVQLSLGFPHFTHLLAKQTCRAAIEDRSDSISEEHFYRALATAVDRVDESIRSQYQQATFSTKQKSNFEAVITACAFAKMDSHKTFSTKDVVNSFSWVTGRATSQEALAYTLSRLCAEERGAPLVRISTGQYVRYSFRNPLVMAYVRIKYEILKQTKSIKGAAASLNKNS